MERPLAIANYFIEKALKNADAHATPMKIVKLVYLAHGWHLGIKGEPLINEPVEAWKYGPVVPSLYREFKRYGNKKIENIEVDSNFKIVKPSIEKENFLDKIWDVYGKYNGVELSTLTHQKGSPWYIVWEEQEGKNFHGMQIPDEIIKYYYEQKAKSGNGQ